MKHFASANLEVNRESKSGSSSWPSISHMQPRGESRRGKCIVINDYDSTKPRSLRASILGSIIEDTKRRLSKLWYLFIIFNLFLSLIHASSALPICLPSSIFRSGFIFSLQHKFCVMNEGILLPQLRLYHPRDYQVVVSRMAGEDR